MGYFARAFNRCARAGAELATTAPDPKGTGVAEWQQFSTKPTFTVTARAPLSY